MQREDSRLDGDRVDVVVYKRGTDGDCFAHADHSQQVLNLGKSTGKHEFIVHNMDPESELVLRYSVEKVHPDKDNLAKKKIANIDPFKRKIVVGPGAMKIVKIKDGHNIKSGARADGVLQPDCGCPHDTKRAHTEWHIDC
jgi:hypothetical protein